MADEQTQDIRYRVVIDRSDVHQAIDELDKAAQKSAESVSALSSGMLSNYQSMAAGSGGMPMGSALAPGMMSAAMYASAQQGAFSPGAAMARDALMMQMASMPPAGMGVGPSLVTPFGDPSINVFRNSQGARPFNLPIDFLPANAPPGAPGDGGRARFFSNRDGGIFDVGRMIYGGMTGRYGNDNLDDRMYRNLERRSEFLAQNLSTIERFGAYDLGGGMAGAAIGGALGTMLLPGAGTLAGSIAGGILAPAAMYAVDNSVGALARPYTEMAQNLRQYTAPYIRGERVGGGLLRSEMFQMQRDLAKQQSADKWFTQQEYSEIVNMAGESGVFQFTGSKEQALKGIEKLADSVKTLHALGVKSRDMLKEIDKSLNVFGLNAAGQPQQIANFYQTMAATAQSANMSVPQLTEAVAPAAQMFASQGIGMMAGARIAAGNLAAAGDMMRQGRIGAFENAFFGGQEGYANALTQATATMYRTPVGQAMLSAMIAPGGATMQNLVNGGVVDVNQIVSQNGTYASNPLRFVGMRALLPKLTQHMGEEMQVGMINTYVSMYRQMTGQEGEINPEDFLGYLVSAAHMPQDQAYALYEYIKNAGGVAAGRKRSTQDQYLMAQAERMRRPTMGRQMQRLWENTAGVMGNNVYTYFSEGNAKLGEQFNRFLLSPLNEGVTGVHDFSYGKAERDILQNQVTNYVQHVEALDALQQSGYDVTQRQKHERTPAQIYAEKREQLLKDVLSNNEAQKRFGEAATGAGYSTAQAQSFLSVLSGGAAVTRLDTSSERALTQLAEKLTDKQGGAAIAEVMQLPQLKQQFQEEAKKGGFQAGVTDAFLGNGLVVTAEQKAKGAAGITLDQNAKLRQVAESVTGLSGAAAIEQVARNQGLNQKFVEAAKKRGVADTDAATFLQANAVMTDAGAAYDDQRNRAMALVDSMVGKITLDPHERLLKEERFGQIFDQLSTGTDRRDDLHPNTVPMLRGIAELGGDKVKTLNQLTEEITGRRGNEAMVALREDSGYRTGILDEAKKRGVAVTQGDLDTYTRTRTMPTAKDISLAENLMKDATRIDDKEKLAAMKGGSDYKSFVDFIGKDVAASQQIDQLKTELLGQKDAKGNAVYTQDQLDEFFGTKSAVSDAYLDRGTYVPGKKDAFGIPHAVEGKLSIEQFAQLQAIADQRIMQPRQKYVQSNLDLVSGIAMAGENDDLDYEGQKLAKRAMDSAGMERIVSAFDPKKTLDENTRALAKVMTGKEYDQLSAEEKGTLGNAITKLPDNAGAGSATGEKLRALKDTYAGLKNAPRDAEQMTLEEMKRKRDDAMNQIGNQDTGIKKALTEGDQKEREQSATIIKDMEVLKIAQEAKSVDEFEKKLVAGGLDKEEARKIAAEYGSGTDGRKEFIDRTADRIKQAQVGMSEEQRGRLKEAEKDVNENWGAGVTRNRLGVLSTVEKMNVAYGEFGGRQLTTEDTAKLATKIGLKSVDDRLGGRKLSEVVDDFNRASGSDLGGIKRFAEALGSSDQAMTNLGMDSEYLDEVKSLADKAMKGEAFKTEDFTAMAKRFGFKDKQVKALVSQYNQAGSAEDKARMMGKTLQMALQQDLASPKGGSTDDKVSGGVFSKEAIQALDRSVSASDKLTKALETLADQFGKSDLGQFSADAEAIATGEGRPQAFGMDLSNFADDTDKKALRVKIVTGLTGGGTPDVKGTDMRGQTQGATRKPGQ